jgi:hypothetical protein
VKRLLRYLSQSWTLLRLVGKLWQWSSLNGMLSNGTARVIYTLPIAGYVILYSDYFRTTLFSFATLSSSSSWGILSFDARINMIYYGSFILLIAFILLWFCCPPLLRNKRDFQQFASDIIIARDRATVQRIILPTSKYLTGLPKLDPTMHRALEIIKNRSNTIGYNAGEYEADIPELLTVYYNWQNKRRAMRGVLIFCLTIFAYALLVLPSIDLFLRVLGTTLKEHESFLCASYVTASQMLHISVEYAACIEWFQR